MGLILSANSASKWEDVRELLRSNADKIDPNQADDRGNWINGRSEWYGSGRLNVFRAVTEGIANLKRVEDGETPVDPIDPTPDSAPAEEPKPTSAPCECRM